MQIIAKDGEKEFRKIYLSTFKKGWAKIINL
jgi:hypothetical protein